MLSNTTEAAAYVQRSLDLMQATDWSRFPRLQDITSGDLIAAALGLYQRGMRGPNSDDMIDILRHRMAYYTDANALACAEQQEFMDRADALRLPSDVLDLLSEAVTKSMRQQWTDRGWTFVDLTAATFEALGLPEATAQEGYYVFMPL